MAGEKTQKIIDQEPKIGDPYSDNHATIPDIWRWPYGGEVHEAIEDGYCPQEATFFAANRHETQTADCTDYADLQTGGSPHGSQVENSS